ncbi:hypothetical protein BGZ68_008657 [Mortierella alpina]|nr:hypothetical protein BGZ68_008657 [Mortierella alpina]
MSPASRRSDPSIGSQSTPSGSSSQQDQQKQQRQQWRQQQQQQQQQQQHPHQGISDNMNITGLQDPSNPNAGAMMDHVQLPNANLNVDTNTATVNPYWPQYQQQSHPPALPLNYYLSATQPSTETALPTVAVPDPSPVAQPVAQPSSSKAPTLNQNQVHARTHPWRIKVYNACLACRKKKIKCDGQPTCQRCERLGFECSYIEVPQAHQAKHTSKQKTKLLPSEAVPASLPLTSTKASSRAQQQQYQQHHHQPHQRHQQQPPQPQQQQQHQQQTSRNSSGHRSQVNAVDAAKEIRQQRRSSTKDAASGSFKHAHSSLSRRKKDVPQAQDLFADGFLSTPSGLGAQLPPRKDSRASTDTVAQLSPKNAQLLAMDRDTAMLDLYHILVNSVTIPNMYKYSQSNPPGPTTGTGGPPFLMGMDHLNLTLASPMISNFTVMSADQVDPDQNHSSFQKDPTANSFLDQSIPVGFVITNKSVIQYLVHVYFECFHPHWMIVDKDKFMAQLKDAVSPPDPLLLVAICAAGAKYSDHEGLCAEPGNLSSIGEQFLTHARILLQDRFDMPSMSTLQALLILYWCQVQTGRASLRFMYVGMAIRMAQEMGLNRPLDSKRAKETDEREIQIRKTIWWSCYQADRWTSAALGKPMVISDVDCLVDYPASVNESDRFHVQAFCHMTDLAKILGKVILNLYTATNAATCSSATFVHLDQSLSAWIEAMPSALDKGGLSDRDKDTALTASAALDAYNASFSARGAYASQQERGRPASSSSKSATPVLTHKEPLFNEAAAGQARQVKDPTSGPEPSSVGYYALLFHTVRIMLYRPFLHNSLLTPILPLSMQSPHSRCRDSAVAISEIAEKMVLEQRSYRQLFNSIHVSLCAAATVHRFVIASPKPNSEQPAGSEVMDEHTSRDEVLAQGPVLATTTSAAPSTLTQAPSSAKSDLYYLALLLRILLNCGRFSIEKSMLRSVIDGYLPDNHLSPQDRAWARDEIHRSFTIVPFAIKVPLPTPGRSNAVVSINLASSSTSGSQQYPDQQPPQSQRRQSINLPPQQTQQIGQQDVSLASNPSGQLQQYQQYQQRLRQHQQDQQQAKQRAQTKRLNTAPADAIPGGSHRMASPDGYNQRRSAGQSGTFAEPPLYKAAISPSSLSSPTVTEQLQYQQHQRELDMLQQHHRQQQTALNQHHQQQALQLEQAQMYNQQQQPSQGFMPQAQSSLYNQQPQQHSNVGAATLQVHTRNRLSGSGMHSPKSPYAKLPEHVGARPKRHSEPSIKERPTWQRPQDQHQQQQGPQERQKQHQQQDSFMADASARDLDSPRTLATLSALGDGNNEAVKTNSAPSGNEPFLSRELGLMTASVGTQRRRSSGTNMTPDHSHYLSAYAPASAPPSTPATPTTPSTPPSLDAIYLYDSFLRHVPPAFLHLYDYFDFVTTSDDYDNDYGNDNDTTTTVNNDNDFNNDYNTDNNNDYNYGNYETDEYQSYATSPHGFMTQTAVISHMTGATDLSGNSGIASLDELLGLDHAGYYSEMPAVDDAEDGNNMDSTTVPLTGPGSERGSGQPKFAAPLNQADQLWYSSNSQQQPTPMVQNNVNSNTNSNSISNSDNSSNSNSNSGSSGSQNRNEPGSQDGRGSGGGPMAPAPMNASASWLGLDPSSQLLPLQVQRQGPGPVYHYPYAFSYGSAPPPASHQHAMVMPPQAAAVPYVGFHAVARSVPFAAANPYAYAADSNSHMGVYIPAAVPGSQGGTVMANSSLPWQQQQQHQQQQYAQFVPPAAMLPQQMMSAQQGPYQFGHVPSAAQQRQPSTPMKAQQLSSQQQQQQQQEQQKKQTQQHQQPKDLQQTSKLEQHQRRMDQRNHPSATLLPPLPPLPQTMYRDDFRSFSPVSSNSSTLVNPSSVSNSAVGSGSGDNSQQDSSGSGSSGRETSTGADTSSRGGSAPLDSSSNSGGTSDSAAMSRSVDSSTGGSNESASNTESPNSTEDISNSNESSGSSSENNAGSGSRSSSIDPVPGGASVEIDGVDGGKLDSNTDGASSTTGSGSSAGGKRRRRRGKKSVSPSSGSNDSSASSSGAVGDNLPSSAKAYQGAQSRHYRTHQQAQEMLNDEKGIGRGGSSGGTGGNNSSSSGGGPRSTSSGSGSSGRGGDNVSASGSNSSRQHQHHHHHHHGGAGGGGGRRKHKNKYREESTSAVDGSALDSGSGHGSSGSNKAGHRSQSTSSDGGGSSSGGGGGLGQGGGRHRAGSAGSAGSGDSSSGSRTRPGPEFSAGSAGVKGSHAPSITDGSSKNRSNRTGKGKGGEKHRRTKSGGHGAPATAVPTAATTAASQGRPQQESSSMFTKRRNAAS